MTITIDQPVPETPPTRTISDMREVDSRRVSEGKGVDYDLVVYWDPETGKVYLAKVTDSPDSENVIEIEPAQVRYHLEHPALIPFG